VAKKNPQNNRALAALTMGPEFAHPDYAYWAPEWSLLRDTFLGEVEVKRKGVIYLPRLETQDTDEYQAYLDRAVFYNMVGRTVSGMIGTLFRRPAKFTGVPQRLEKGLKKIGKSNESLELVVKLVAQEIIHMGRVGVLLDMDANGSAPPYLCSYISENIVDWETMDIDGRCVLSKIVLREIKISRASQGQSRQYFTTYRICKLVESSETSNGWAYVQEVYENEGADASIDAAPSNVFTPKNRGVPFSYIPFVFFGPYTNGPDVEKSPVYDIATLNLSHYRSYAHLEHGRFFTGLPIYYVQVNGASDKSEYHLGPSTVWEVGPNEKPGVIEFNGHGLKFLESALDQKEQQVSSLGGRLLGFRSGSTAESDNVAKTKERNEQSTLLNVSSTLDTGFTQLLQWWLVWQDVPAAEAEKALVESNKDFLFDNISAREFRAIHAMYTDGILPIEVVHDYLRRAEVIPDWLSIEELKKLLTSTNSFPMQPDAEARQRGYPNRQSEIDDENADLDRGENALDREHESEEGAATREHESEQAEAERKAREREAKLRPPPQANALRAAQQQRQGGGQRPAGGGGGRR